MAIPTRNAWVLMILAAFISPLARRILAITDEPMPNISPRPVTTIKSGATLLTAAMPLAPTPCPTNTPSIMVRSALKTIPIRVGKNSCLNNFGILSFPKSRLSRSRCLSFFITCHKKTDKMNGFTQSSYPALYLLPSDEDYKTLWS